jgi:UDP-3-O-[3-hydroxymyristoyl] glucosamine N-acyltransferase
VHPVSASYTISDILNWTGGRFANEASFKRSPSDIRLSGVSGLKGSRPEQVAFFFSPAYKAEIPFVRAGVLITGEAFVEPLKQSGLPIWNETAIVACKDPYLAMALLSEKFAPSLSTAAHVPGWNASEKSPGQSEARAEIHPTAVVHASAQIGAGAKIGAHCGVEENARVGEMSVLYAGCFVGPGAKIGRDTVLFPNVVIYEGCEIGNRVRLHANVVIGADGFGYAPRTENGKITKQVKIYHVGKVIVGDDVEVGAATTIDRGTLNDTLISQGVKIDNNVQVGHNVKIGEGSIICAGVGLAGTSTIGKYVYIAGLAGVNNGTTVHDEAKIGPGCLVSSDAEPGKEYLGFPPRLAKDFFRLNVLFNRMLREQRKKG